MQHAPRPHRHLDELAQVAQRVDLAFLVAIDGADAPPADRKAVHQAVHDHFHLKLVTGFGRFMQHFHQALADQAVAGLVIGDAVRHRP